MDQRDDLWPPFGPADAFRQSGRRPPAQHGSGRSAPGAGDRPGERDRPRDRGRPAERGRSRRGPALSREEIVDGAIAVADAYGAEAISMRRIAQLLRVGAMSLYWHVAGKEHLLELMLDTLIAEVAIPEPTGDWQADLRAQARGSRAVLLRHRWVIDFIGARPGLGPNTLRYLDRSLAALSGLDVDTATAMNVLQTVNTYVSGAILREFQELRVQREQEKLNIGSPEFKAAFAAWRQKLAATGQFDHFLRMLDDNVDPDAEETRDERFEFGLNCVLAGIAAELAKLTGPEPES